VNHLYILCFDPPIVETSSSNKPRLTGAFFWHRPHASDKLISMSTELSHRPHRRLVVLADGARPDLAGAPRQSRPLTVSMRGWRIPWVHGDAADPFWALLTAVMFCAVVGVAVLVLP
jgi:hypothetical protein